MSMIVRENAAYVAIDFQEKLMPVMSGTEKLEEKTIKLVKGLNALGIPGIVTQQYTKGIGETIPSIKEALGEFEHVEKNSFSCMANEEFVSRLEALGKKDIIVFGIEAHICVQQTVLQLLDAGYNVYLAVDCISSRSEEDKLWGITRMGEAGAAITTYEAILYEILRDSKADGFKAVSAIVK